MAELKILLLEDNPADAELNQRELRRAGLVFTALRVDTEPAFKQALEDFKPDIVLADYNLPGYNGHEALSYIQQHSPDLPVIMVTGAIGEEKAVELLRAGGRDYILKDRLTRLPTALQRVLDEQHVIRARHEAEQKLRESEYKFKMLFETANDGIFLQDETGFVDCNQRGAYLYGLAKEEIIGHSPAKLCPEKQPDGRLSSIAVAENIQSAMRDGSTNFEWQALHFDKPGSIGTPFDVDINLNRLEIGGKVYLQAIVRDITKRKLAEKELLASKQQFMQLFMLVPIPLGVVNKDGVILYFNERFTEAFGYTLDEVPTLKEYWQLVYPDESYRQWVVESWNAAVIKAIREGKDIEPAEYRMSCKSGAGRIVIIGGTTIGDNLLATFIDITERKQAEIALNHANRALATISAVNRQLVHATEENELLQAICKAIVEPHGYKMAWVGYAQHDEKKSVKVMASAGYDDGYLENINVTWAETERGMGPTGRAIRSGTTQLSQDFDNDPRHQPWRDAARQRGYAASISLPLIKNGEVFGALTVYASETNAFTLAEIALLEEMAGDLAFGVSSLHIRQERDHSLEQDRQHIAQLQDSLEDTVRAIAGIVEMRDPYTAGHQAKVADLAAAIARQMGLSDERVHAIHLAGAVHDLGKIQIPSEILSKPGRISDIEFSLIKTHAQAGYDILKGIRFPWPIAQMVFQHHERFDGSGYPQGLKGEAILLEARILAVADVVEAMYAHRPYRPALGLDAAMTEITKQRGIFFDPTVVDACVALFREQRFNFND